MGVIVNRILRPADTDPVDLAWHVWNDRGQVIELTQEELAQLVHDVTIDGEDAGEYNVGPSLSTSQADRHPEVVEALRRLDATSTPGGRVPRVADEIEVCAEEVASRIGDCPELVAGLEKLAEARDLLVAAYYAPDPFPDWEATP